MNSRASVVLRISKGDKERNCELFEPEIFCKDRCKYKQEMVSKEKDSNGNPMDRFSICSFEIADKG